MFEQHAQPRPELRLHGRPAPALAVGGGPHDAARHHAPPLGARPLGDLAAGAVNVLALNKPEIMIPTSFISSSILHRDPLPLAPAVPRGVVRECLCDVRSSSREFLQLKYFYSGYQIFLLTSARFSTAAGWRTELSGVKQPALTYPLFSRVKQ